MEISRSLYAPKSVCSPVNLVPTTAERPEISISTFPSLTPSSRPSTSSILSSVILTSFILRLISSTSVIDSPVSESVANTTSPSSVASTVDSVVGSTVDSVVGSNAISTGSSSRLRAAIINGLRSSCPNSSSANIAVSGESVSRNLATTSSTTCCSYIMYWEPLPLSIIARTPTAPAPNAPPIEEAWRAIITRSIIGVS